MKSAANKSEQKHALFVEWGGLTAGAYGRPAIAALLLMVLTLIWFKFA